MRVHRRDLAKALGSLALAMAAQPHIEAFAQNTSASNKRHLIISPDRWQLLRSRIAAEPDLMVYHESLLDEARKQLDLPALEYKKTGRRLLNVSRALIQRCLLWGYAFQTTGDEGFAKRVAQEMLNVSSFEDWNPSHFLDVAEMTTGLALGLDWAGSALTVDQRQRIHKAIHDLALQPALISSNRNNFWHKAENNWNQVCIGGIVLGALVLDDSYAPTRARVLEFARQHVAHGMKPYAPDGVYPEGSSYWGYGSSYSVLLLAVLRQAIGETWQLEASPGFLNSAQAYVQMHGATGLPFNFSDSTEKTGLEPALFWFAEQLKQPQLLLFEMNQLNSAAKRRVAIRGQRFAPLAAVWWPQPQIQAAAQAPGLPLRWYGQGENALVVCRSAWNDPQALYFAIKAGSASLNHAHMDVGSFVFELGGVRWAIDLGLQDYESLESKGVDLWNKKQDSPRWQVFRLSNHAHSTLTLNNELHKVSGKGRFTQVDLAQGQLSLDMSPVFLGQVRQVERKITLTDRKLVIRDEARGLLPGSKLRWQMPTRAAIEVRGNAAMLSQSAQRLQVKSLQAAHNFFVQSLEQPSPAFNARNPGVSMLLCEAIAGEDGRVLFEIELTGS